MSGIIVPVSPGTNGCPEKPGAAHTLTRDNRIADMAAVGNLMNSTGFLATTSIFILGGLMAMLGASDLGRRVVAALP